MTLGEFLKSSSLLLHSTHLIHSFSSRTISSSSILSSHSLSFSLSSLLPFSHHTHFHFHFHSPHTLTPLSLSSPRKDFYGPGGGYHIFAGKDASRALAKSSLDPSDADNTSIDDLTQAERSTLDEWAQSYADKYDLVGFIKTPTPAS
jgi:hypothetical protein